MRACLSTPTTGGGAPCAVDFPLACSSRAVRDDAISGQTDRPENRSAPAPCLLLFFLFASVDAWVGGEPAAQRRPALEPGVHVACKGVDNWVCWRFMHTLS